MPASRICRRPSATPKRCSTPKDPQEYLNLNAAATQPTMEKAIAYSRSVYEVAAQTNGELAKLLEAQAVEFKQEHGRPFSTRSRRTRRQAPTFAVQAVKSALAAANTAYESFQQGCRAGYRYRRSEFRRGDFRRQGIQEQRGAA